MKYLLLLLIAACFIYSSTANDENLEEEILARCKYVKCKGASDLAVEVHIRDCIKTTCSSKALKRAGLAEVCKSNCIAEAEERSKQIKSEKESETILDYSWLN